MDAKRRIVSLILSAALLAGCVLAPVPAMAADDASYYVSDCNFAALTYAGYDAVTAAQAGVYDISNLHLGGNHGTVLCAQGYMGEGWYIQKVCPGGNRLIESATLELDYWICAAGGYVDVYISADNLNYTKLVRYENADAAASQQVTLDLTDAIGSREFYVKIAMQHWDTWEGAAVRRSTVYCRCAPTEMVSSDADFSKLPCTWEEATASSAGLDEVHGMWQGGNYGTVLASRGYMGEGWYVQHLTAQKNKVLLTATLTLDYWIHVAGGYIDVYVSDNGIAYQKITRLSAVKANGSQQITLDLPGIAYSGSVYVKIAMQHWDTWEGAAVKRSLIEAQQTDKPPLTDVCDFTALTRTGAAATAQQLGVFDARNINLGGNSSYPVAGPTGYSGEGYVVQRVAVPDGKLLTGALLLLDYRICRAGGYVNVDYSADGVHYTALANLTEADAGVSRQKQFVLPITESCRVIYIKVTMQHWDTWEGAALRSMKVVGFARTATGWCTNGLTGLRYYYSADGVMNTASRVTIDGKICNFYPAGSIVDGVDVSYSYLVGWKKMPGKITRYYPEGEYWFLTGFQPVDGKRYFFDKTSGALYIPKNMTQGMGWYRASGAYYALSPETGEWIVGLYTNASGDTYYYKKYDTKASYTTGLVTIDEKTYYFDPADGKMAKNKTVDFGAYQLTFDADGKLMKIVGVYNGYCYDENGDLCAAGLLIEAGGDLYRTTTDGKLDDNYWKRTDPRDSSKKVYLYKGVVLEGMVTIDYGAWTYNNQMGFTESGTYFFEGNSATPSSGFFTAENGLEYYFSASGKRYESADYAYISSLKTYCNFYRKGTVMNGMDYSYAHKVGLVKEDGVVRFYRDGLRGCVKDTAVTVDGVVYTFDTDGRGTAESPEGLACFGDSGIDGVMISQPADLTVSGTSRYIDVASDVGETAAHYACRTLEGSGSSMTFTVGGLTPNRAATLEIEEIHCRTDEPIGYTVSVNGAVAYRRTYAPIADGPNHFFFEVAAATVGDADSVQVTITNASAQDIRIRRVWATSEEDSLARSQNVHRPMQVVLMLNQTPEGLDYEYLKNLVESYRCSNFEIGLCWEIQYMAWGKETTEQYLSNALEASRITGAPLYLGINSWWAGTPCGLDGRGGTWQDAEYQQITYDAADRDGNGEWKLSTPNQFSDTPWLSMNNEYYNEVRARRIEETVAYIQRRTAELNVKGQNIPPVHLYTENEPIYWPIHWTQSDFDSYENGVGDYSPAVKAAAAADGVTLDPTDGLTYEEKYWLYKNLGSYISGVGEAMAKGCRSDYILVSNGTVTYPTDQLTENSYTHSPTGAIYPNWEDNRRAWENHVLDSIHFGGEWANALSTSEYSTTVDGDTRTLDYLIAYGSYADINCERSGMRNFNVLSQSYVYGLEGVVIYNVLADSDAGNVKGQNNCAATYVTPAQYGGTGGDVSGMRYTGEQTRVRNEWIAARADCERLFSQYLEKNGSKDSRYFSACSLYCSNRYGDCIEALSAAVSEVLPADFTVYGEGRLGSYPVYVTAPQGGVNVRLLEVGEGRVRFTLEAAADASAGMVTVSLMTDSGSYSMSLLPDGSYLISEGNMKTATAGKVTFSVYTDAYRAVKYPGTFECQALYCANGRLYFRSQDYEVGYCANSVSIPLAADVRFLRGADGTPQEDLTACSAGQIREGDRLIVTLNGNGQAATVYAWYGTVTGTVTAVSEPDYSVSTANAAVTVAAADGRNYTFEIGGMCRLNYAGAPASVAKLCGNGRLGLAVGTAVTVSYSPYIVNDRVRALSID